MEDLLKDQFKILNNPSDSSPFLIVYKPSKIPSAPLSSEDKKNALSLAAEMYPQILQVKGRKDIEHGLLHRLDTETSGLMIIALTQECFDFLNNEQKNDRIQKFYSANCDIFTKDDFEKQEGFPPLPDFLQNTTLAEKTEFSLSSYFRYFGLKNREVRPVTQDCSKIILKKIGKPKIYSTNIKIIESNEKWCRVDCKITNGFKHQVRAHLAWCGLGIIGDKIYNPRTNDDVEKMQFTASKIIFEYPKEKINIYEI